MNNRWIESHSVNCLNCGLLVDERDCVEGPDGEGSICQRCQKLRAFAREMLVTLIRVQTLAFDPDRDWAIREIEYLADETISKVTAP